MIKQTVIVLGQDRRLKRTTKPVFGEWLYEPKIQRAWFTLRKLYASLKFCKNRLGLVIDERFALPLNPYESYSEPELKALISLDERADQALNLTIGQVEKESHQNIIAWALVAIVSAIVLVVVILALLVASGRLG